ncbi:MAG: preprotein translocase subunit YajC [Planctomycetota bacterium]|jgi:preprotein translocase subunit YajC
MSQFLITLAQGSGEGGGGGGGLMPTLIMIAPLILVFYFLLIRPQRQKEKERREMLDRVKKGDKVVTTGGILGEVVRVSEREIVILVDKEKNARLRMLRTAIYGIIGPKEGEGETSAEGTADKDE